MQRYDPTRPLIFIHVPKTAGTSVQHLVQSWFPDRFHKNYFNPRANRPPAPLPASRMQDRTAPPVIYGHFNRNRHFGIEHLYPEVTQFITILRDPFDTAVSNFFYAQKRRAFLQLPDVPEVLDDYLEETPPNILNHFPRPVTQANYREMMDTRFICIGLTERLPESLSRIAAHLGQPFDAAQLQHLNASTRDQQASETARARYRERHPLEFEVYEHACRLFDNANPPG